MKINLVFVFACLCVCVCVCAQAVDDLGVCDASERPNKSKLISFAVTHGVCGIFIIHVSQRSQMDTCSIAPAPFHMFMDLPHAASYATNERAESKQSRSR